MLNEGNKYTQQYNYCNKVEVHTWLRNIKLALILQHMHIQTKTFYKDWKNMTNFVRDDHFNS
jgi:hypothetical protein